MVQAQGSLAHSVSVCEEERDRAAPVSGDGDGGLSGLLTQHLENSGSKEHPAWLGPGTSKQSRVPPRPPPRAVRSSRWPRFLWMWSLAPVNPMAPWLSGNQVCTPGLADKGCVLVSQ